MDTKQNALLDSSVNFSLASDSLIKLEFDPLPNPFNYSDLYLDIENELFMEFAASLDSSNQKDHEPRLDNRDTEVENESDPVAHSDNATGFDWNPRTVLTDLASVEQKIHKVQDIVRSIIDKQGKMPTQQEELAAQQQLVSADFTSIIKQLISTVGSLLPSAQNALVSADKSAEQLENGKQCSTDVCDNNNLVRNGIAFIGDMEFSDHDMVSMSNITEEDYEIMLTDDHDVRDCEDVGEECESLLVGSYEVLQLEKEEILAPPTHLCQICGKGFKRDANLRMHMRGHGDQYKTPGALAKPINDLSSGATLIKRYSCPSVGCKRNKEHKDFQPLKTLLCMKNHYKRTHCDKRYTCSRCNKKKFSVLADLKTHEKHCGRNEWLCSCGTTFSRKDKLFGHVALFQGHAPALHVGNTNNSGPKAPSLLWKTEAIDDNVSVGLNSHNDPLGVDFTDIKDFDTGLSFNQSATFCAPSFGGFHEFPRP